MPPRSQGTPISTPALLETMRCALETMRPTTVLPNGSQLAPVAPPLSEECVGPTPPPTNKRPRSVEPEEETCDDEPCSQEDDNFDLGAGRLTQIGLDYQHEVVPPLDEQDAPVVVEPSQTAARVRMLSQIPSHLLQLYIELARVDVPEHMRCFAALAIHTAREFRENLIAECSS